MKDSENLKQPLCRGLRNWALHLLSLPVLVAGLASIQAEAALPTTHKVIGYVPSWRGNVNFVRYDKLTHINYAFLVVREDGSYTNEFDPNLLQTVVTQAHAQGVKVLISVGGGANANPMGKAITNAAYPTSAATLKSNLLAFMATYQLDGIDLDWEYPQSATDTAAFTTFVTGLATEVHVQHKLLTAATVGANWVGQYYSDASVSAFDYLNVMAYDVAGVNHSSYQIAADQLTYWANRGVPASKLVLGVPFYGYPTPDFTWSAMAYKDILASDPTAYSKDVAAGYAYNGVPTMVAKTQLAMTNADGIMIWELSMDSAAGNHSLLDAIAATITSNVTTYTISASAGAGGSISPSGSVSVMQGASQTFTITPAAGYAVDTVLVDGASKGAVTTYTFSNVTAAHTVSATFKLIPVNQYTLTASAGTGGSISPSGVTTVSQGSSQTYVITPSIGYTIASVMVDGASQGAIASYTFSNVSANHTISATFSPVPVSSNLALGKAVTASSVETADFPAAYAVDGNAGTRWASAYTDPSWITVDLGSVTPINRVILKWEAAYAKAYQLQVSSDNQTWTTVFTQAAGTGGVEELGFAAKTARYVRMYGTSRATQWGYSLWEFEVYNTNTTQFTLTASAGANGTISPSGAVKVNAGASQTFTITPNAGYAVDQVLVDGTSQGSITSYTFSNVSAAHTIAASFKASTVTQYTLTASAGANGAISPTGAVKVNAGASQTFTLTPATGYAVDAVLVDGTSVGSVTTYTFSNVSVSHTISATFKAASVVKATGAPGNPHLSHDNWSGETSFTLHMTMWYGNNGSSWEVYENGALIMSSALVDNSPNQQDATYPLSGKKNGTYTYTCKLINGFGVNTSDPVTVTVTKGTAGLR